MLYSTSLAGRYAPLINTNVVFEMADMRVHSIILWMRSTLLLHISGGKVQFTVFFAFLPIPLHGHGNNGGGE